MNSSHRPTTARQRRIAARVAKQRRVLLAIAVCFVSILVMFFALICGNIINRFVGDTDDTPSDDPEQNESPDPQGPDQPIVDPNTTYTVLQPDAFRRGDLILVNLSHEYTFPTVNQNLINVYDSQVLAGTLGDHFQLPGSSLLMDKTAYNALDKMLLAFYNNTAIGDVQVYSAYRSYADQQGKGVPPGYSDSHTGLSCAMNVINAAGTSSLASDPVYQWIYDNCYKYGFTVRYPVGKETITQVSDYDYYFRYVGYIHAYVMKINDMCLEEYISYVQGYSKGTPLSVTGDDGVSYEIYYVAAAKDGSESSIPVPNNHPYTISGDNEGGFIVTVTLS